MDTKNILKNIPTDKVEKAADIVEKFVKDFSELFTSDKPTLPEGIPSVVYGLKGIQQVFRCGESKAQTILDCEEYQSAFLAPKGTRNRPCNVAKLFEMMSNSKN